MHKAISVEKIENRISQIRGKMVMLDKDLAKLYGVETKNGKDSWKQKIMPWKPLKKSILTIRRS